jgi:Icc-related predicted phosphoesterase
MRIHYMSDLHLEHSRRCVPDVAPGADCIVIAGDTSAPLQSSLIEIRRAVDRSVPVIAVAGNHDFYRTAMPAELEQGRLLAEQLGIHLLENDAVVIGGVRFVGASLWTDYALFGEALRPLAMREARERMNDHRLIRWSKEPWMRFRPEEALRLHRRSRAYIEEVLAEPFAGPTVVVTHHAPHPHSLHDDWRTSFLSAAYASDLSDLIVRLAPQVWIHGHVHRRVDYWLGRTRVVSNPCGYPGEVTGFDPALILEVGT